MKGIQNILAAALALVLATISCTKNNSSQDWPWVDPEPVPETGVKPRFVWIDASANFHYFANDRNRIVSEVKKIAEMGFSDIVVDVRPTEGTVLYNSNTVPRADRLAAWIDGKYVMVKRTETFDYLQAFIDAGHEAGLRVFATMNTFVGGYGGYYGMESVGPIFTGEIPASWATMINSSEGVVSSYTPSVEGTVFLNPASAEVQDYVLGIIKEIAAYDVDGIVLDRCRYDDNGLMCEFSETSRAAFESFCGKTFKSWPSDVFAPGTVSLPETLSDTQKSWLAYRAKTIHDFVVKASDAVHSVREDIEFGLYVGAWYSTYYESGVNWASPKYNTSAHYSWASREYSVYGFADHCDFMMLGCYAIPQQVYGTTEWTMQGFATLGKKLMCSDTPCYGGPDIGNSGDFANGGQDEVIPKTVDAIINACDGYFAFDLCHIRMFNYWSAFKRGINNYLDSVKK